MFWRIGAARKKGEIVIAGPAFRFGAQRVDKLRAVDDLKRSPAKKATVVKTTINLPSWGHIAQMCMLFDMEGEACPVALAKADHADGYKQLLLKEDGELAAVVTLTNPTDGLRSWFIPCTQLFGSAAAILRFY